MSVVNSPLNRLSYLSNGAAATAFVVVLILLLVLECVSNILVKNFRFSRTRTSTSTKIIRLDHMHTPYACTYFFFRIPHSNFRIPDTLQFLTTCCQKNPDKGLCHKGYNTV